jgi:hypothetical protein
MRRNHKKNPVFLLSSHATAQEEKVWGRHGRNPRTKPKVITSCNNSLDIMLYTYLEDGQCIIGKT